jgi:hypothetical protein
MTNDYDPRKPDEPKQDPAQNPRDPSNNPSENPRDPSVPRQKIYT